MYNNVRNLAHKLQNELNYHGLHFFGDQKRPILNICSMIILTVGQVTKRFDGGLGSSGGSGDSRRARFAVGRFVGLLL